MVHFYIATAELPSRYTNYTATESESYLTSTI